MTRKEIYSIVNSVYDQMPPMFTSQQFGSQLLLNNIEQKFIDNNHMIKFIKNKCSRISRFTWSKNNQDKNNSIDFTQINFKENSYSETQLDEFAKILKDHNWKVYKPVQTIEYKEI